MSEASLHELEREVEIARAKLTSDLSTLRSPATFNEFTEQVKQEARDARDAIVEKAKSTAQSTIEGIIEDLKAKAAANPAATLAIGAGVAWRFIQHPPIATALIGAGLFSLLRTTSARANGQEQIDYLSHAQERLKEQTSEMAAIAKRHAMDMAALAKGQAGELTERAKDSVMQWGDEADTAVRDAGSAIKDQARLAANQVSFAFEEAQQASDDAARRAAAIAADVRRGAANVMEAGASRALQVSSAVQNKLPAEENRGMLLLGVAGLAVAAALGIAYQRRMNDEVAAD